jgi:uncharacterized membrane protein
MFSICNKAMLAVTAIAAICQFVYWYPILPDVVASHFDHQGNADGTMAKTAFFVLFGLLQLLFLLGMPLLAKVLPKFPNSMVNCPNKEYWLAPERRDQTMNFNAQFLVATGWLTSWLFIGCFHLSSLVSLEKRATIEPEFIWMMAAYLIALFTGVAWMFVKFRLPAEEPSPKLAN